MSDRIDDAMSDERRIAALVAENARLTGERDEWRNDFLALEKAIVGDTGLSAMTVATQAMLYRPRATRAEAEVAALRAGMVVKPLVWDKHPDIDEWYSKQGDAHGISMYCVWYRMQSDDEDEGPWMLKICGTDAETFQTPDLAKGAAQEDWEARIALIPTPPAADAVREAAKVLLSKWDADTASGLKYGPNEFCALLRALAQPETPR